MKNAIALFVLIFGLQGMLEASMPTSRSVKDQINFPSEYEAVQTKELKYSKKYQEKIKKILTELEKHDRILRKQGENFDNNRR